MPDQPDRSDLVVVLDGRRISRACAARGWSYSQLAWRAKVSRPTMTAALRGKTLRPLTAWKIARALSQEEEPTGLADLLEAR